MKLSVEGRRVVSGTHRVSGNKNAALPMIAAALLSREPVVLTNVPDIADVSTMLDVARSFGAKVSRDKAAGTVTISANSLRAARIAPELAAKLRTSILFAGPLLARLGRASLPPPGGDAIKGALRGAEMLLDEASVTATENLLMASVLAKGRTVIYNAACEPHVENLAAMLRSMGARVAGAGTNRIEVEGVESLHGCEARVGCDYIEAGSYLVAAAATGGEILLTGIDPEPFRVLEGTFARFGISWTIDRQAGTLRYVPRKRLRMKYDFGDAIPSVSDGPWPAFPSDLMGVLIVLATQTRGTCLFFEKMFESRLYFVDQLRQMGAKIVQCDPHRVVVTGPSPLYGGTAHANDIRAGISLVIAALCAKGESTILNAETIDRGYVSVEKSFSAVGAKITRL